MHDILVVLFNDVCTVGVSLHLRRFVEGHTFTSDAQSRAIIDTTQPFFRGRETRIMHCKHDQRTEKPDLPITQDAILDWVLESDRWRSSLPSGMVYELQNRTLQDAKLSKRQQLEDTFSRWDGHWLSCMLDRRSHLHFAHKMTLVLL